MESVACPQRDLLVFLLSRENVIYLSQHSLHPILIESPAQKLHATARLKAIAEKQQRLVPKAVSRIVADSAVIPLTTVSLASNFDAYINIQFRGQTGGALTSLLVDSGNSVLIVPSWEDIQNLPGYTAIGEGTEPWGSPAKIVRGPIDVPTQRGEVLTLEDCVFYACTGAPERLILVRVASCLGRQTAGLHLRVSALRCKLRCPTMLNILSQSLTMLQLLAFFQQMIRREYRRNPS